MAKTRKKTALVPADETKADKFVRLAEQRVPKAIKAIGNVGNLANKSGYEFTATQVDKIAGAIADAAQATHERFIAALNGKTAPASGGFKL